MKHLIAAVAMALAAVPALPGVAQAHFQLAFPAETLPQRSGDLPVRLIFWHPLENGPVMDMGQPGAVWALHRGQRIELGDSLAPFTFQGALNVGRGFDVVLPVRRAGDYVIAVEPAPYFEASEDKFIQQFTKSFVNRAGLPTDWDAALGLAAEILPLVKPYNIPAGGSFTGRVMAAGKPVPDAEIEVEYIAATPRFDAPRASAATTGPLPGGAMVIRADDRGYFTFALPRAGHWGFAALDVGETREHEGKPLSQDAVIWVLAHDMEDK